ncbi:hypothetical protein AAIB33_08035 [Microbacterium sp. AZCO]|uniref:hypothetical protein n=1 Tax=Microbacterium sp. AZCO TaxID=3142976 RepID=UPI0031F35D53
MSAMGETPYVPWDRQPHQIAARLRAEQSARNAAEVAAWKAQNRGAMPVGMHPAAPVAAPLASSPPMPPAARPTVPRIVNRSKPKPVPTPPRRGSAPLSSLSGEVAPARPQAPAGRTNAAPVSSRARDDARPAWAVGLSADEERALGREVLAIQRREARRAQARARGGAR